MDKEYIKGDLLEVCVGNSICDMYGFRWIIKIDVDKVSEKELLDILDEDFILNIIQIKDTVYEDQIKNLSDFI